VTNVNSVEEFYSAFPERRINPFRPELRAVEGSNGPKHIWGYASMFNKLSRKLGGFVERVDNRAFTAGRASGFPDVVCRFNHNDDFLLGTVNARTCLIDVDGTGLIYDVVPPSFRDDIIELMERGDVCSSSFAFRVPEGGDDWGLSDFNYPLRTLLSVDLVDVAPVTTPAYPDATSSVRSMDGAVRSLATRFDIEPAEIRSLLEANQGVKLFKRTDRSPAPVMQITASTGENAYSTGSCASNIVITTTTPQEGTEMQSAEELRTAWYEAEVRAKYDAAAMKKMAASGAAMKNATGDPSYPIADEEDLHNAIHAVGRGHASHEAIRQHIIARAKALGLSSILPAAWTGTGTTPAASDSSSEKNSAEETSEDRAAKAAIADLDTCGNCGATDQYEKHCTNCGNSMEPPVAKSGNGKFCANCGGKLPAAPAKRSDHECDTEERTEALAEEAEVTEEVRSGEEAEVTEEVTNGHVIDSGEAQLAKLGLQRRQRIAELQEKRFDPFLGTDE
jgi:hypothetical protein